MDDAAIEFGYTEKKASFTSIEKESSKKNSFVQKNTNCLSQKLTVRRLQTAAGGRQSHAKNEPNKTELWGLTRTD